MGSPPRLFTLVLHTHLPYVISHGMWPHGMDWLNEATAESYLPLLNAYTHLVERGISPRATMSITPVLAEQLADESFHEEFDSYLGMKIEAAEKDAGYFRQIADPARERLAYYWRDVYGQLRNDYNGRYGRDLIGQFRKLQDAGHLEIITSAATHGYLALLGSDECVRAQLREGVETYERHFGRPPRGIWLPECAYRPPYRWTPPVGEAIRPYDRLGIDSFLSELGITYFILDTHLLRGGQALGAYIDRFEALKALWERFEKAYPGATEYEREASPLLTYYAGGTGPGQKPVAFLTRHPECSLQVWSGEWGYPGDGNYLDFHKKHFPGGHRYWAVTAAKLDLADKRLYEPAWIDRRLDENADHFVDLVGRVLGAAPQDQPGVVCAPFDTELFGHWWYEGPRWIERILERMSYRPDYQPATGSQAIEGVPPHEVLAIPEGSWGEGGYHYIWLNQWTTWTWQHVYEDEVAFGNVIDRWADDPSSDVQRLLRQAAREMLLLESSDWQFLISTWSARDYAELRFSYHHDVLRRLIGLVEQVGAGQKPTDGDWLFVEECEKKDSLFPDIDPRWWLPAERQRPAQVT